MLFNSLDFALFLPVVLLGYYALPQRFRWVLLLVASYVFYMSWRWEYAGLLVLSTLTDYVIGLRLERTGHARKRKWLLGVSLLVNLSLLGFFKYQLFFVENINSVIGHIWAGHELWYWKVLLPVGISFYTFQTLSYTIDVYRRKHIAERHLGHFAVYVCYFPQLVAGPIERPQNLLPDLREPRPVHNRDWVSGLRLMLWGFFKKLVVADNAAEVVDAVYADPQAQTSWGILLAGVLFCIQIYADFSGYSDIAIGTARLMGQRLMLNFSVPYFSRSLSEFWRRWHISLSSWFRDYVYVPLGGSRVGRAKLYRNLLITFVVSGFWHGANWTFVLWGLLHGLGLCVERAIEWRPSDARLRNLGGRLWTLSIVLIGFMLFRANDFGQFSVVIQRLAGSLSQVSGETLRLAPLGFALFVSGLLLSIELALRNRDYPVFVGQQKGLWRFIIDSALLWAILSLGKFTSQSFLYFQF